MGIPPSLLRLAQALRKRNNSTMNSLVLLSCLVVATSASYIPALGYAGYGLGSPLGLGYYGAGLRIAAPYSSISAAGVVPTQNILPRGNTFVTPAKLSYTRNADGSASGALFFFFFFFFFFFIFSFFFSFFPFFLFFRFFHFYF